MNAAILQVMEDAFQRPLVKFDPARQSLKAWVMFCLRDRGFKVVYAQNADFAIEGRTGEKIYFKVSEIPVEPDPGWGWVVWDRTNDGFEIIPPQPL